MIVRRAATLGRYRSQASLAALLVANAIPLLGVLFFGWSLITILVLYWLENGIIGLWNIPRIALARGDDQSTSPMLGRRGPRLATNPQASTGPRSTNRP